MKGTQMRKSTEPKRKTRRAEYKRQRERDFEAKREAFLAKQKRGPVTAGDFVRYLHDKAVAYGCPEYYIVYELPISMPQAIGEFKKGDTHGMVGNMVAGDCAPFASFVDSLWGCGFIKTLCGGFVANRDTRYVTMSPGPGRERAIFNAVQNWMANPDYGKGSSTGNGLVN
jgi:hypothetical protein